jgi:hypothetical protein
VNHLSILIKKIEQSLRQNPRSVPLLDTVLMILVIAYGIMKITKSLGVEMSYSMIRSCTKISCRERNRKNKNQNTQCLMRSLKKNSKVPKNQNVQQQDQQVPQTPASVVRRSTRLSRPPPTILSFIVLFIVD